MSKAKLVRDIWAYLAAGEAGIYDALVVEPTNICDHNDCPYCYMSCKWGMGRSMTLQTAEAVAMALTELDIRPKEIRLAGGEPMMCPRLTGIIQTLSSRSDYFALITNGLLLSNPKRAQEVLANPLIKEVAVSLHSADRGIHNWMVGRRDIDDAAYDSSMSAVLALSAATRPLTVSINLNMNMSCDLSKLIGGVQRSGGRIDKVIFQLIDFEVGRAKTASEDGWLREFCRPTITVVSAYFAQAQRLLEDGDIKEAVLIDALPNYIVEELDLNCGESFYQPAATPAISVGGRFRPDVVRRYV